VAAGSFFSPGSLFAFVSPMAAVADVSSFFVMPGMSRIAEALSGTDGVGCEAEAEAEAEAGVTTTPLSCLQPMSSTTLKTANHVLIVGIIIVVIVVVFIVIIARIPRSV